MSRPRVLQVATSDDPPFADLCAAHAVALRRAGAEVSTVFLCAPRATADAGTHHLAVRSTADATRQLRARFAGQRFVLLLTHRHRAYWAACRAVAADRQVAVAHEFGFFARRLRRLRQRLGARHVCFAGVSRPVADDLLADHPALRRTRVVPNLLDLEAADPARLERDAARDVLGCPHAALLIGVVGRLHAKKRPALAVDGFAAARPGLPAGAQLVFVGDGPLEDDLRRRAAERGLASQVRFCGRIPVAARLMPAFDLLLLTSSAHEAFGMVLLEAMAADVPVVCADQPGPRSVLGETGLRFDSDAPADVAAALVAAARRPPGGGRARVEQHFCVPALAEIHRTLIEGS